MTTCVTVNRSPGASPRQNPQSEIRNPKWPAAALLAVVLATGLPVAAGVPGAAGDLYVSSSSGDCVNQYDGQTGAYVGQFVTPGSGGLDAPSGLVFAPDGSLLVGTGSRVLRYDGQTGAYLGVFIPSGSGGLGTPTDLTLGPNGNVYVASAASGPDKVLEYDGDTGAFVRVFAADVNMSSANYLSFVPDGDLFVSGNGIWRYDGQTGASLGTIGYGSGLSNAYGLTAGPNGNLFVAAYFDRQVYEFDGVSGDFIGIFADGGNGNFYGVAFGPDGDLFVSTINNNAEQFHGLTGALQGVFAQGEYETRTWRYITFKPFDNEVFPAPSLTDFQPAADDNCDLLPGVTITGSGLAWGAKLWLTLPGEPARTPANVTIDSATQITADFDLSNAAPGWWDLELYYADGQLAVLANAIEIAECPAPVITGFDPVLVDNCAPLIGAVIAGENFILDSSTTARLTRTGEDDIEATNIVVESSTTITADFDLTGVRVGTWNLALTYPDETTDTLVDAVEVTPCPPPVVSGLSPDSDDNCGWLRGATIIGSGFYPGAVVRLASPTSDDVVAVDNVAVLSPTTITADFAVAGVDPGSWDLTVHNPGDPVGDALAAALEITACPPLEITGFTPPRASNCATLSGATISGVGFASGATVTLRLDGDDENEITGTGLSITPTQITATFNVTGAEPGLWDVIVRNTSEANTILFDALRITSCYPDVTSPRIQVVSNWGGQVNDVFVDPDVDPNIAYVAAGRRLVVLNVADPANAIELGAIDLQHLVQDVEVRDGYAYVAASSRPNHFCVVDVSDPEAMAVVWRFTSISSYVAQNVVLRGDIAYVRSWNTSIQAFDISDPTNVKHVGDPAWDVRAFTIDGDRLYVGYRSGFPSGLQIYDLAADPTNPPLLGSMRFEYPPAWDDPIAIEAEGDYAYVITRDAPNPVCVVDVSDPTAPFVTGYFDQLRSSNGLAVSDGYVFVADWTDAAFPWLWADVQGLAILDVATNPASPTLVSSFQTHGTVWRVRVYGDRAYVMDQGEGLIILDISNPADPVRLGGEHGGWYSPASLRQIERSGNDLFITDEWNGFTVLDVADPGRPAVAGVYQTPETGHHMNHWSVKVRNEVAFLSAGFGHLQAVDVSDPATPTLLGAGNIPEGYYLSGLDVRGNLAYAGYGPPGGGDFGLVSFDVADPRNMSVLGNLWVGSPIYAISVTPARSAFLARQSNAGGTLTSVDVSAPAAPAILADVHPAGTDLARDGNLLYMANQEHDGEDGGGLHIYDVSDPATPIELSHFPASGYGTLALQNDAAFIAGGDWLFVIDVSNPTAPFLIHKARLVQVDIPGTEICVDGRTVYLTSGDNEDYSAVGLTILDMGMPGDADGDWDVDLADFATLQRCYGVAGGGNPGATSGLNARCLFADFDQDDDVDTDDFALFADAFTGCDPPTTDPTGACCLPDGTCRDDVTEPDCTWRLGGVYQGDGSTCDNVTCPPTGACCLPYGSIVCEQYTEDACNRHGGTWWGEGSDCATAACVGACCDPATGECTDLREAACNAAGGVYQGDGTVCGPDTCDPVGACCIPTGECIIRTAFGCSELGGVYYGNDSTCDGLDCPFAGYSNEIDPVTMFIHGDSLAWADDMTLAGGSQARDLVYYDLGVYGGDGGGTFDVTVGLYTDCPGNGGTLIAGTERTFQGVAANGYWYLLTADLNPPVTLPGDTVWMVTEFSVPTAGWLIAEEAEIGTTLDIFGSNDPRWVCNYVFQNHDPYAGFWANLRCVESESKARGDSGFRNPDSGINSPGPVLRIEPIEFEGVLQPVEVTRQRVQEGN